MDNEAPALPAAARAAESAVKEVDFGPPSGWLSLRLRELWGYRDLLYFLIWRDIKVRYKQTLLGAAWAILQPLMTMVVFSLIFGKLARMPTDGIPYPIFSFTALLPWQLFSRALSDASSSLVTSQTMITKVYFPRILLPLASILSGVVDFAIALVILIGMMFYYRIQPTWAVLTLPLFIVMALATAMAVGLWLSALNVLYRDVKYVTPFLINFWLYATPVAYSSSLIPEGWRSLYGLNPLAGVVEGFRWALLGQTLNVGSLIFVSAAAVVVLLVAGLIYFQRMELTLADMV
jgi:lipopolysaccharide transport system permease protein